jgi:pheromone shutdown protein TraB
MLHAVRLAQQKKIPIALVDQDIRVTLKRLSKGVSWLERVRFAKDLVGGVFGKKKNLPFDLRTVPSDEIIESLIKDVRKRYPNLYRVLVQERNEIMARRLAGLARRTDGKVLAVVGAGHTKEIAALIRRYLAQTI